jgi:hypothetical protein
MVRNLSLIGLMVNQSCVRVKKPSMRFLRYLKTVIKNTYFQKGKGSSERLQDLSRTKTISIWNCLFVRWLTPKTMVRVTCGRNTFFPTQTRTFFGLCCYRTSRPMNLLISHTEEIYVKTPKKKDPYESRGFFMSIPDAEL